MFAKYGVSSFSIDQVIESNQDTVGQPKIYKYGSRTVLSYSPEQQKIYGHVITEVKEYPRCKMLVIQYCAGEENHMQYCEDKMYELLDKFAKDTGCVGIELIGRPGWGKHVKKRGYEVQSVMYQKFFKD